MPLPLLILFEVKLYLDTELFVFDLLLKYNHFPPALHVQVPFPLFSLCAHAGPGMMLNHFQTLQ